VANTSSRTLRLLSLLQTHRYWPGADLADRLEVSVRTLRRDIERLRELGYPVSASRGVTGGYQLAPGAALPPLVLDDEEAVALAVGLQAAAQSAVAGIAESSLRALAKVARVMPPELRRQVEAVRTMTEMPGWDQDGGGVDPGALVGVAQGCRDAERLRFGYTAASGASTERHVEPLRLVRLGRRWYLVAYDLDRHDWRSFRLDRLDRPTGTGGHFRPRELPAVDAAAFVRAGIGGLPAPYEVEAVVRAPAERVRAAIGRWSEVTETIDSVDGPAALVRMHADSLDWPAMALGSVGAEFTVVGPPAMCEHLRDWGARFTRAVAGAGDRLAPEDGAGTDGPPETR
jgi:predicted DNA-binding transcriptional regulator YafY